MMSTLFKNYLPESFGNSFSENDQFISNNKKKEAELYSASSKNDYYSQSLINEDLYEGLDCTECFA